MTDRIKPAKRLRGEITAPGDKSISHRAIMFSAISKGRARISGFLDSADCRSTVSCFREMGAKIEQKGTEVTVEGGGLKGLKAPERTLYAGNSGTTVRLISGIMAGQNFSSIIDGDDSIRKRPMKRIMEPLSLMGANISGQEGGLCPLNISPAALRGIEYTLPVASAQVKSCILLAGLYANSETIVTEPVPSRDHTERMLKALGADISRRGDEIHLTPGNELHSIDIPVPGDISSAAYFIAAGLIHPDAELLIKNVNINPTRAGIIQVARDMGGNIELLNERVSGGEEVCDIRVCSSSLHGTTVSGDIIPALIDELPVIAVMAAAADGTTTIADASELKKKESDRIATVTENLRAMGADITPTEDGMIINGGRTLAPATVKTYADHRIAMSFAVAGLCLAPVTLDDPGCVNISFTDFYEYIDRIGE